MLKIYFNDFKTNQLTLLFIMEYNFGVMMNRKKVDIAYPNGVTCKGSNNGHIRVMCVRNLPKVKYNVSRGTWTVYLNYEGERIRVIMDSYDSSNMYLVYLRNWFSVTGALFKKAMGAGLSGIVLPVKDYVGSGKVRVGVDLERAENNLRYYAKHKAKYEYIKLFRETYCGYTKKEIEERYLRDVRVYSKIEI